MAVEMELKDDVDGKKKYVIAGDEEKKPVKCKVLMLDGTEAEFTVDENSLGAALFMKACESLNLLEIDYFGLTFLFNKGKRWLKKDQPIKKQLKKNPWKFNFEVKFYPRDPCQLKEELTRYQLYLQTRVDLLEGKLLCSHVSQVLLASHALQSQLGDWEPDNGDGYVERIRFYPSQTPELLADVVELHKSHKGMPAEESEFLFLDNAKAISLYGYHFVDAINSNGSAVKLGVSGWGMICHKDLIMLKRHHWTKIIKISFKKNKFTILLRSSGDAPKDVEEYTVADRSAAKHFWRLACEHHSFFRLKEPVKVTRGMFTRGNTNVLNGATQYQMGKAAEGYDRQNVDFCREYHTMGRGVLDKGDGHEANLQSATVDRTEEVIEVSNTTRTLDRIKKNRTSSSNYLEGDDQHRGGLDTPGDVFYQGQLGDNYSMQNGMRVSMDVEDMDRTGQKYLKTPYPSESQRRLVTEDMEFTSNVTPGVDSANGYSAGFANTQDLTDEIDHDKMLADAIMGVTDYDQNLCVEKIEITKNE